MPNTPPLDDGDDEAKESPDMKFARMRLQHLISRIRNGELRAQFPVSGSRPDNEAVNPVESRDVPRGPGRPKKPFQRERPIYNINFEYLGVVFELRGKPFALRSFSSNEAVYSLCRIWMRGKEDELLKESENEIDYPEPDDDSLELLATKEILAMPRPRENIRFSPFPEPIKKKTFSTIKPKDASVVLEDYLPHWRNVKNSWKNHREIRDRRYDKSIHLLNTVYNIAQQNTIHSN
ncbi:unnamed protein product [Dracunculus medinensis]|uniref:Protein lin-37 homolog n=1 Tax=Dracunculus medinensis TaxID=318479 RepID=A0A0N4UL58_DRAME|nr:unnamed protein product [Dracunculus medinensis]